MRNKNCKIFNINTDTDWCSAICKEEPKDGTKQNIDKSLLVSLDLAWNYYATFFAPELIFANAVSIFCL